VSEIQIEERLRDLKHRVGRGVSSSPGVTVPPLASDEVKAAAERFSDLRDQAVEAYRAAEVAHADAGAAREARVKARTKAVLDGRKVKAAELAQPEGDVSTLIEEGEALCAARDQARAEVVKAMEADNADWKARNAAQVEEAKAALREHLLGAEEAFDRLGASAHLRLWLEGRNLARPSKDIADGYGRLPAKVDLFPGREAIDADKMFDGLRSHYAIDGVEHAPVEAVR
jgi:hypothetical protein